jgi:uncharacterized protein (DUF362 family)
VTTRKEYIKSFVDALRQVNSITKIYLGEGEGGYNTFPMTKAMQVMGFYDIEKKYPNVRVVNISNLPSITVELQARGKPYPVDLPSLFFDEIVFSITCPVPEVHYITKVTLAFKHQRGCLPDTMRLKNHYVLDAVIGQICDKLKFRYAFLDGKYGLDKNGPMTGVPRRVDWFVASNDLGAFDVVVSEIMGFDWRQIGHLKEAAQLGFIPDRNEISIVGDIESLKTKFRINPTFWNYPALAAFRSKRLTHLFYFSRWAKPLHDIMYIFRKRPLTNDN